MKKVFEDRDLKVYVVVKVFSAILFASTTGFISKWLARGSEVYFQVSWAIPMLTTLLACHWSDWSDKKKSRRDFLVNKQVMLIIIAACLDLFGMFYLITFKWDIDLMMVLTMLVTGILFPTIAIAVKSAKARWFNQTEIRERWDSLNMKIDSASVLIGTTIGIVLTYILGKDSTNINASGNLPMISKIILGVYGIGMILAHAGWAYLCVKINKKI